jgi:hypothetical protein
MQTITGKNRVELMRVFAQKARECDRRGDVTLRVQASNSWRELATDAEAKRAPGYLTWSGRARKR